VSASSDKRLDGLRVLVTRARHQSDSMSDQLQQLGAEVVCLPMIEILPPESWEPFDKATNDLPKYDWIIFASANAVNSFFARLNSDPRRCGTCHAKWPRFATIGPKTTQALREHGLQASYQAEEFVAESFAAGFPTPHDVRVLWPKTNIGRTLIADELTKAGARVEMVHCYRTALPTDAEEIARELHALLQDQAIDVITLASSQTAKNMRLLLNMVSSDDELPSLLSPAKILAIGPETARTAQQQLLKCDIQAEEFTVEGMIEALLALGMR
jgi:uroporphyrinogen-III synthase